MAQLLRKVYRFGAFVTVLLFSLTLIKFYYSRVTITLSAPQQRILPMEYNQISNDSSNFFEKLVGKLLGRKYDIKICDYTNLPELHKITKVNELWQTVQGPPGQIMVYGAYMDTRPGVGHVTIRVSAVTIGSISQPVYCQLWFENVSKPLVLPSQVQNTGRGLGVSGAKYQERLYSCIIYFDVMQLPQSVSLVFSECDNSTMNIPIHVPFPTQKFELGVCVVVAYGTLDPVKLVEWVEFQRILGVEEINVYDSRLNNAAKDVFDNYRREHLVRIHPSAPPLKNWCKWCQKLAVISTLNDCLYRNMYKYKHLMVIDFDEFIIPVQYDSIPKMISYLRKTWIQEPPAYMFRNAYFFLDYPPHFSSPSYLITSRYLTRAEPSKYGYAAKSIINPRKCVSMQNHYCMIRTPDVSTTFALNVKPEIGLSHHYKTCHLSSSECQTYLQHPILDQTASRFSDQINQTVYQKLKELKILRK